MKKILNLSTLTLIILTSFIFTGCGKKALDNTELLNVLSNEIIDIYYAKYNYNILSGKLIIEEATNIEITKRLTSLENGYDEINATLTVLNSGSQVKLPVTIILGKFDKNWLVKSITAYVDDYEDMEPVSFLDNNKEYITEYLNKEQNITVSSIDDITVERSKLIIHGDFIKNYNGESYNTLTIIHYYSDFDDDGNLSISLY